MAALTFPVPLADFALQMRVRSSRWRLQEFYEESGTGHGDLIRAEIAAPKWMAEITTAPMTSARAQNIRAIMRRIGAYNTFYLHNHDMPFPAYDPTGALIQSSTVTVHTVGARTLRLQGLPTNYELRFGDFVSISYGSSPVRRGFFEISQDVTTPAGGITPTFEVTPPVKTGIAAGNAATLFRASAQMQFLEFDPGVGELMISGGITFTAVESR